MDTTLPRNSAAHNGGGKLDKASSSAHAAVDSIANAADDAARKAAPAIGRVASAAHQAVDKAVGAAAPTADWLSEQADMLHEKQKKLVAGTGDYVAAHPFKSIGIAVVAGFVLSRFFR